MSEQQVEEMNLPEILEAAKDRFLEVAPNGMEFAAERAFAIQQLRNNDYLMKCAKNNKNSLLAAMFNVAAVGLSLNPAKKQAYLVPRGNAVCLDFGYMGLCDLAIESGGVKWLQANTVFENDTFEDNGPGEKPRHTYKAFAKKVDRGPFAGVYCVAKTADGDYLTTLMDAEDVESIRMRSELGKKNQGPWATDYNEQAKKSVVRRAYKMLPKTKESNRMDLAVQLSNEAEGFEPLRTAPQLAPYTPEMKQHYDYLISSNQAVEMYLFAQSLDESHWNGLFSSFEKGTITKYKKIVEALYNEGQQTLLRIAQALNDAATRNDDAGILENIHGLSSAAMAWLDGNVSPETSELIRVVLKAQESNPL